MKETIERCDLCGKRDDEASLYDSLIANNEMRICEECSSKEAIPILKRPTLEQLNSPEKQAGVRERLARLVGFKEERTKNQAVLKIPPAKINKSSIKLVDNFHWEIMMRRRRKGITLSHMARALNQKEDVIKMLEKGIVPENAENLIKAVEQFLHIRLIKEDPFRTEENFKRTIIQEDTEPVLDIQEEKIEEIDLDTALKKNMTLSELNRIGSIKEDSPPKEHLKNEQERTDFSFRKSIEEKKRNTAKIPYSSAKTPSIYDLMKRKQERDKEDLLGRDIELEE
jgi:ribosome-binding protein aMBF1 (putative translation factor)